MGRLAVVGIKDQAPGWSARVVAEEGRQGCRGLAATGGGMTDCREGLRLMAYNGSRPDEDPTLDAHAAGVSA